MTTPPTLVAVVSGNVPSRAPRSVARAGAASARPDRSLASLDDAVRPASNLGVVRDGGPAAVDRAGGAGDDDGLVGEQVGDRGRDLLGASRAADRVQEG